MSFRPFDYETPPEKAYFSNVEMFAKRFNNPLIKKSDVARILIALLSVAETTEKGMDRIYLSAAREAADLSGKVSGGEFYDIVFDRSKSNHDQFSTDHDAYSAVGKWKDQGLVVGLKLGHYRRLTITQIFELIVARKVCDKLVLVIESGERTKKFKTPTIELSDQQRFDMLSNSSLADMVLMTSGLSYGDQYYRNLIGKVKPNVLFMSSGWQTEVKEEYKYRANMVGAELCELPSLGNLSTTSMEKYF
jgi:bifunctional ADP-heptose synthase (sugar kinase/adenylyltransferase)